MKPTAGISIMLWSLVACSGIRSSSDSTAGFASVSLPTPEPGAAVPPSQINEYNHADRVPENERPSEAVMRDIYKTCLVNVGSYLTSSTLHKRAILKARGIPEPTDEDIEFASMMDRARTEKECRCIRERLEFGLLEYSESSAFFIRQVGKPCPSELIRKFIRKLS